MSIVDVWKPSAGSSSSRHSRDPWTEETIGGIFDRQGRRYLVFDVDATRQAARQRALPCDPVLPAAKRRLDAVCAPGDIGRKRGEVVRTRTDLDPIWLVKVKALSFEFTLFTAS